MKVFISQPMFGKTNEQIRIEREELVNKLQSEGHEIIDSIIDDYIPPTIVKQGAWYLGKSLKMLSQADAAYFMIGWDKARGCKIEHQVAVYYEIEILHD